MIYVLLSNIEYDTEEEAFQSIKESYAHFIEEKELKLTFKEVENEK